MSKWTGFTTRQVDVSVCTLVQILARELEADELFVMAAPSLSRNVRRLEIRDARTPIAGRTGDIRIRQLAPRKSEVSFIGDIMGPSRWRTFQLVVYSPMLVMMIGVATWRFGWLACAAALLFFAWMF